ncbi:hypothetical protein AN958_03250 [Leucoagaricus sp. SymC.cos]|nr:hypothetical protein AN958_03250 [Leucoagaricus sp. SymC.cos]
MPAIPPPGHKSHKNNLTVRSEAWRRLENIYQIDPMGFAQQILTWASHTIKDMPFKHEDPHMVERLSLGTRREDGLPDQLDHPMDTIDRLGAFLDTLPLMSAQRLFHILYPDTLLWRFQLHQGFDIDQTIFDYFLWTRTQRSDEEPQNRLVVAYQPPWILTQADFEEFVRCAPKLPPHVTPGHAYPPDLLSKHRVWAKLWDICVQNNTKWFVVTSWNVWAFGGFSDGWCSGIISDIWHLDEHTPSILECLTFWMASAMERKGSYRRPQVGCIDSSNPRRVNMPARLCDVLDQDLEAVIALTQIN